MRLHRFWAAALSAVLVAAAAAVGVPAGPAYARAIEENFSVTVSGAFGDRAYTPQSATISFDQSNQVGQQVITIGVSQNDGSSSMSFDFSSRDSSKQDLQVEYYGHAQQYRFTDPGRPGLSIGHLGFCNDQSGNFEVRDIRRDGPAITAVWITYHRYCDGAEPVFGEIRLGYPDTAGYDVSPRNVRWTPGTYPGRSAYDVPVTVRSTSTTPVDVTSVAVVGTHAADFPIRQNACTGSLTAAGCRVVVGFSPKEPGPRHAKLRVSTTSGDTYVALDGPGALGRSAWVLDVDHEDISRPDEHLDMEYSASKGTPYGFRTQAFQSDGTIWNASFDLPGAETFAEGRTYTYNPDGTGLLMSLARGSAACEIDRASITITDLGFSGPDQELALLDMTMDVHCRANYGDTVTGRLTFHDRDDLTAPAAATNLRGTRVGDDVTLEWTNPSDPDLAGVVVRWYGGRIAPTATDAGQAVHVGTGNTVRFSAPSTSPVAASLWAYDTAGNVSLLKSVVLEPLLSTTPLPTP